LTEVVRADAAGSQSCRGETVVLVQSFRCVHVPGEWQVNALEIQPQAPRRALQKKRCENLQFSLWSNPLLVAISGWWKWPITFSTKAYE